MELEAPYADLQLKEEREIEELSEIEYEQWKLERLLSREDVIYDFKAMVCQSAKDIDFNGVINFDVLEDEDILAVVKGMM